MKMVDWVNYYSLISGVCLGLSGAMLFKFSNFRGLLARVFKEGKEIPPAIFEEATGASKRSKKIPLAIFEDCKMVLVVRTDLSMGKGKIAAQCCHAALGSYKRAEKHSPQYLSKWLTQGQPKIVVKLDNRDGEEKLYELQETARALGVPCIVIHDAGHTQVQSGTATCAGFGPAPTSLLDQITGQLKLL